MNHIKVKKKEVICDWCYRSSFEYLLQIPNSIHKACISLCIWRELGSPVGVGYTAIQLWRNATRHFCDSILRLWITVILVYLVPIHHGRNFCSPQIKKVSFHLNWILLNSRIFCCLVVPDVCCIVPRKCSFYIIYSL